MLEIVQVQTEIFPFGHLPHVCDPSRSTLWDNAVDKCMQTCDLNRSLRPSGDLGGVRAADSDLVLDAVTALLNRKPSPGLRAFACKKVSDKYGHGVHKYDVCDVVREWTPMELAQATQGNFFDCVELYNMMDDDEWYDYCVQWVQAIRRSIRK